MIKQKKRISKYNPSKTMNILVKNTVKSMWLFSSSLFEKPYIFIKPQTGYTSSIVSRAEIEKKAKVIGTNDKLPWRTIQIVFLMSEDGTQGWYETLLPDKESLVASRSNYYLNINDEELIEEINHCKNLLLKSVNDKHLISFAYVSVCDDNFDVEKNVEAFVKFLKPYGVWNRTKSFEALKKSVIAEGVNSVDDYKASGIWDDPAKCGALLKQEYLTV